MSPKLQEKWEAAMTWLFALGAPVAAVAAIVGVVSWAWRMFREAFL